MKVIRFIAASLAATTLSLTASGLSLACDKCRGQTPCRACGTSDDNGLLDGLDRIAQRLRPRLPRLPSLDSALRIGFSDRGHCDAHATCGCELSEPTCGCELKEPSCGCESPESCDCRMHAGDSSHHLHQHVHQDALPGANSTPSQRYLPYSQPVEPFAAPIPIPQRARENSRQAPNVQLGPTNDHNIQPAPGSERQQLNPVQPKVPDLVPLPDSEVDPFRDDAATRVRRIPTRAIQYRQPSTTHHRSYDEQARHDGVRIQWNDALAPAASQRLSRKENSPDGRGSSQAFGQHSSAEARQSEVVTAAAETRQQPSADYYRSNSPATGSPTTVRPIEIRNPLRD